MKVAILVPRKADHGPRDEIWRWLRGYYSQLGWPIYEGFYEEEGPFNCSIAFNRAADHDWDVAVTAGADCLVAPDQMRRAVERAATTGQLVLTFSRFYYLSEEGTQKILNGYEGDWKRLAEWGDDIGNGPAAIRRDLWDRVGGRDPGFVGWGYEDVAFRLAASTLGGESRVRGSLFHLWHPESSERADTPEHAANRARYIRYLDAAGEGRMEQFLASL